MPSRIGWCDTCNRTGLIEVRLDRMIPDTPCQIKAEPHNCDCECHDPTSGSKNPGCPCYNMTKRKWRDDGLAVVCPLCGDSPDIHPKCPWCDNILLHSQIDPADWTCRRCPWASYDPTHDQPRNIKEAKE